MQSIFNKEKKRDVRIKQKREKMESRKRKRIEKKKWKGPKKEAMTHEEVKDIDGKVILVIRSKWRQNINAR